MNSVKKFDTKLIEVIENGVNYDSDELNVTLLGKETIVEIKGKGQVKVFPFIKKYSNISIKELTLLDILLDEGYEEATEEDYENYEL